MKNRVVEVRDVTQKGLVELVLNDGTLLLANKEVIEAAGVKVNDDVDLESLSKLINDGAYNRGFEAALNYLEYRPRSEAELRQHLRLKHRYNEESIQQIIDKLKDLQLIDDKAFAEIWIKDRVSHKPKSRLMMKRELLQKGIAVNIADDAMDGVDDAENAYKAGMKKAKLLRKVGQEDFNKRLTGYLARRGFTIDIIRTTVALLWEYICNEQNS